MPLRDPINNAVEILLSFQNEDGGIPAVKSGQASGCWTTSDTLEDILTAGIITSHPISRVKRMIDFLLDSQIGRDVDISGARIDSIENPDVGGWPLFLGAHPSTMATGHAVGALQLAFKFLDDDSDRTQKIEKAVRLGFRWLERNQNEDGGWGPEPTAGRDGKESKIVATFYALIAYKYRGATFQNSRTVRKAVEFLISVRNRDGSWGFVRGLEGDPCNTARAITCLKRTGYCKPDSQIVKKALRFILRNQLPSVGFWDLAVEGFFFEDASAQLVYNNNTVCDVLVAFTECEYFGRETHKTLVWLLESQEENGLWHLSSPVREIQDISTWSTAEWIFAIDLASKKYLGHIAQTSKAPSPWRIRLLVGTLIAIITIETFYAFRIWNGLVVWWWGLPEETRKFITGAVIVALIINLIAASIFEFTRGFFRRLGKNLLNWAQARAGRKKDENESS